MLFSYIEIADCFQALGSLTRKRGEEKPSSPSLANPLPRSHGAKGRMTDSVYFRISKAHQGRAPFWLQGVTVASYPKTGQSSVSGAE